MNRDQKLRRNHSTRWLSGAVFAVTIIFLQAPNAAAQWTTNGNNISNTNTDNVGIGTTSPTSKLAVEGNAYTVGGTNSPFYEGFRVRASDFSTNGGYLLFGKQVGNVNVPMNGGYGIIQSGDNAGYRHILLNPSGGFVGIGTTAVPFPLTVRNDGFNLNGLGSFRILGQFDNVAGSRGVNIGYDDVNGNGAFLSPGTAGLAIWGDNGSGFAERLRVTGAGNVGIGTASPNRKLELVQDVGGLSFEAGTGSPNAGAIRFGDNTGWKLHFGRSRDSAGGALNSGTSGVLMTIQDNGNVGLNTTTPGYRLDVQGGQINSSGGLCIAGECKTAWSQVGSQSQWTTNGNNINNTNTGNVGIGTTGPGSKLTIYDSTNSTTGQRIEVGYTNSYMYTFGRNPSTGYFNFSGTNASGSQYIGYTFDGNLGIGTTNPIRGLQVSGANNTIAAEFILENTGMPANNRKFNLWGDATAGTSGRFYFRTLNDAGNGATKNFLAFDNATGNVGIGTTSPTAKLDVNGDINVTGNINSKFQDIAEWVTATHALPAGTVVTLNPTKSNQVTASSTAYDTRVAGVISERPGLALGEAGKDKVLVATTGRVKVKVDASRSPIQIGDLLVTSDKEGVAMKSVPLDLGGTAIHRPGTLIGKALEPLEKGTGEILVLLSLQ